MEQRAISVTLRRLVRFLLSSTAFCTAWHGIMVGLYFGHVQATPCAACRGHVLAGLSISTLPEPGGWGSESGGLIAGTERWTLVGGTEKQSASASASASVILSASATWQGAENGRKLKYRTWPSIKQGRRAYGRLRKQATAQHWHARQS